MNSSFVSLSLNGLGRAVCALFRNPWESGDELATDGADRANSMVRLYPRKQDGVVQFASALNRDEWARRAYAAHQAGRIDEAIIEYRYAAAARPDSMPVFLNLAFCLDRCGRWEESAAVLQYALLKWPKEPRVLMLMGDVQYGLGDLHYARRCYEAAVRTRPWDLNLLHNLTAVYRRLNMRRRATRVLPRFRRLACNRLLAGTRLLFPANHCQPE